MERILFVAILAFSFSWGQKLPAFPTAEGFGKWATGGRGGEVYQVTNLNDSGPGSLREGLSKSGRTIVFTVGGVIKINDRLVVPSNTTIAGQTAPGGGITVYGNGTAFNTHNVITRHIRIRMGRGGSSGKDAVSVAHGNDMIWDHVSISWGRDGNFDANPDRNKEIKNLTIQNCIIAQGLQTHSTGGLMIADGASILRTLYINNNSRNPKARKTTQFVNNVVYNWTVSGYILGDTQGRSDGYMVGNWFGVGPQTRGGVLNKPTPSYHLFARDNYYSNNKDGTMDGRYFGKGDFGTVTWYEDQPSVEFPAVTEWTAMEAYERVYDNAGANRWRDEVDKVFFGHLRSLGKSGAQPKDEKELGLENGVGIVPGGEAPKDSDGDGMPDEWEIAHGLDPNNPADRNGTELSAEGYTNLEMYLNELAGDPVIYKDGSTPPPSSSSVVNPSSSSEKIEAPTVAQCGAQECASLVQGEDFCAVDGIFEEKNAGFMGTGYVNVDNAVGTEINYKIAVENPVDGKMYVRYANGVAADRPVRISAGSQVIADSLVFPSTGAWTEWQEVNFPVNLNPGIYELKITSLSEDGGPNIDWLGWDVKGIGATNCDAEPTRINVRAVAAPQMKWSLGALNISGLNSPAQVEIRTIQGQVLQNYNIAGDTKIQLQNLPAGWYVTQLKQGSQVYRQLFKAF
ncbi:MAG: T9SS type A sorting domain-containing protein [Fibrobacter sp.]|nr:T9SS type A sorting domain-containing protein [Fibrobacter sp.]